MSHAASFIQSIISNAPRDSLEKFEFFSKSTLNSKQCKPLMLLRFQKTGDTEWVHSNICRWGRFSSVHEKTSTDQRYPRPEYEAWLG